MDHQPSPPVPAPISPVLSRKFPLVPILSVFVVLLIAATAYLAYQNWQLTQQVAQLQMIPIPPPTPTLSPTANWKTYTNEAFNFSIKYPAEAKTASRDPGQFSVAIQIDNLHPRTGGGGGPQMEGWLMIISEPQRKESTQTLSEWAELKQLIYKTGSNEPVLKEVKIGGHKAIAWTLGPVAYRYYLVEKDPNHVIFITINMGDITSGINPVFDQILSTFKFLDSSSTFTCPLNGWIDCMPILTEEGKKACSPEALAWYKKNCPNFQGVAQ